MRGHPAVLRPDFLPRVSNSDSTVRLVWAPALQAVSPSRSDHPLLRIFDAAVEAGLRRLAVEGEREVAERVGRVQGPVVHRLGPQRLQLVVVCGAREFSALACRVRDPETDQHS